MTSNTDAISPSADRFSPPRCEACPGDTWLPTYAPGRTLPACKYGMGTIGKHIENEFGTWSYTVEQGETGSKLNRSFWTLWLCDGRDVAALWSTWHAFRKGRKRVGVDVIYFCPVYIESSLSHVMQAAKIKQNFRILLRFHPDLFERLLFHFDASFSAFIVRHLSFGCTNCMIAPRLHRFPKWGFLFWICYLMKLARNLVMTLPPSFETLSQRT